VQECFQFLLVNLAVAVYIQLLPVLEQLGPGALVCGVFCAFVYPGAVQPEGEQVVGLKIGLLFTGNQTFENDSGCGSVC